MAAPEPGVKPIPEPPSNNEIIQLCKTLEAVTYRLYLNHLISYERYYQAGDVIGCLIRVLKQEADMSATSHQPDK